MKIKKLFETPKKAVVTSLCFIAAVGVIGSGSLFTVEVMAENKAIGKVEAEKIALKDASLTDSQVRMERTEFEYENGQYVYDVEFTTNEKEYDYWIDAYEGRVLYKEVEAADDHLQPTTKPQVTTESKTTTQEKTNEKETITASEASSEALPSKLESTGTYIGVDKAKSIAVKHAGRKLSEVNFTKAKLEDDNGKAEYEIEFYYNNTEYEYTIDASKGIILDVETEEED